MQGPPNEKLGEATLTYDGATEYQLFSNDENFKYAQLRLGESNVDPSFVVDTESDYISTSA